jgi:hypothetical protein
MSVAVAPSPLTTITNSSTNNFTQVPDKLEGLNRSEIESLLKRVASERDELQQARAKKPKTTVALAPVAATPVSFNVTATKKRISAAMTRLVKKTAHNEKKKPWTEVSDSVPSAQAALQLLEGYAPASNTARLIKWELKGTQVHRWLGCAPAIHPVKFDGKVLTFGGAKPKVIAWAAFEKVEVKFEKNSGT